MKKVKRILIVSAAVLAVCVLALVLSACAPSQAMLDAYDDDAKLATFSSYYEVSAKETNTGNKFTYKVNSFSGAKKIKNITVGENPELDITLTVSSGRFKLILVKGSEVITICDKDTTAPVKVTAAAGTYTLKIAGKEAKADLEIKFS